MHENGRHLRRGHATSCIRVDHKTGYRCRCPDGCNPYHDAWHSETKIPAADGIGDSVIRFPRHGRQTEFVELPTLGGHTSGIAAASQPLRRQGACIGYNCGFNTGDREQTTSALEPRVMAT